LGFAQVYPSQDLHDGGPLWILNDLYVAPEARRSGLGTALLRHVASEAPCDLTLKTAPDNPALQLYRREGYAEEPWSFLYCPIS
jgi:GNAT superfamily N-acetyltransferase